METILSAFEYDKKNKSSKVCHIVMGSVSYIKSMGRKKIKYIKKEDDVDREIVEEHYFFDIYFNSGKVISVYGDSFFNLLLKLRVKSDKELREQ